MTYEHFSFALHELRFENAQIVSLCKRVVQFLAEQGAYCQYLCIAPLDKKELKKSFPKILNHLDKYEHPELALECGISCFDYTDYNSKDYTFTAKCGFNNGSANPKFQHVFIATQPTFHLEIARNTYERINSQKLFEFLKQLVLELRPRYGYWTLTDCGMGSFASAMSRIYDPEESQRAIEWQGIAPRYQAWNQGYIRNIFSGNYLNEEQLVRYVNQCSLAEWIQADKRRGVLEPVTPDLWYWQIEHELIPPVRAMLDAAQITFKREYVMPLRQLAGPPMTQAETLQMLLDNNLIDPDAMVVCIDPDTRKFLANSRSLDDVANIAFKPQEIINAANAVKQRSKE